MQRSEKAKFKQLVQMLGANFRADVTTPLLQAYWVGLSDLPIETVTKAVRKAMRECEHFPAVAKIRALARKEAPPLCPQPIEAVERERARCTLTFSGKGEEVRAMLAALPADWRRALDPVKP